MTFPGRAFLKTIVFCLPLALSSGPVLAQNAGDKAIIVFDASGSMWGQIGGKSKIQIARETLDRVVGNLPQNLQLGMIAYGHNRKGDCSDIETLVEIGPAGQTGRRIAAVSSQTQPKGQNPALRCCLSGGDQIALYRGQSHRHSGDRRHRDL